jgi:plastocyanin domain-containing protein
MQIQLPDIYNASKIPYSYDIPVSCPSDAAGTYQLHCGIPAATCHRLDNCRNLSSACMLQLLMADCHTLDAYCMQQITMILFIYFNNLGAMPKFLPLSYGYTASKCL